LLAAGAVASLPFLIAGERQALDDQRNTIIQKAPKPLTNLDLTVSEAVARKLAAPLGADFTRPHNLLNPVQWQKGADGRLYKLEKGNEVGPEAAVVVKTTPLNLVLTFDSTGPTSGGSAPSGFLIGIERQAAPTPAGRRKKQTFATLNVKKEDLITLREARGPEADPEELVIELADTGEKVSITKEKPYRRVDGYMADLRYDPEKKNFAGRRVNDTVMIAGEAYKIVAISENEVVVSHNLTGKKSTIRKKAE
jgi:hypothetical protein